MSEIEIRALQASDYESAIDLFLAPGCRWGTLQMPYQSRDAVRQKLENPPAGMHRLVAIGEDGSAVGLLGLHTYQGRRSHVGGIGLMVHDERVRQGIGSKLMEAMIELAEGWLGLERIELTVYTDNPAIRLYEKYGFEREGIHKAYARRDGEYIDSYFMARVRTRLKST